MSAVLACDQDFALEVIRLYQAFTQDLILEAVSGILWSEEFEELCMELAGDLAKRPEIAGGFYDVQRGTKTNIMCSACNLVCHPETKVRTKRLKMWRTGGVSVQHEDGRIETIPVEDARAFLEAMLPDRRALYEDIESKG